MMAGKQSPKIGSRTRKTVGELLADIERNVALAREVAADRDAPIQAALRDLEEAVGRCVGVLEEAGA